MKNSVVAHHKLDLLLSLINTTTGVEITDSDLYIERNGEKLNFMNKGGGNLVFINIGRENFILKVKVKGFYEKTVPVVYEELDSNLPVLEVHMIPNDYYQITKPCHTFTGTRNGLISIDAVKMSYGSCQTKGYDERKRIINIFNPHRIEMKNVFYAIVNLEKGEYEVFEIVKRVSDEALEIKNKLQKEFLSYYPISKIVFGEVSEDGNFLLKVAKDAGNAKWIVRFTFKEEEIYKVVDFNRPETMEFVKGGDWV